MNSYNESDGIDTMPSTTGVKLFVGQIPREMDEDTLIPYFAEFGPIIELTVIRDRLTKTHKGCAFVTYLQIASAHQAIEQLHDKIKLGHAINPLQVRIAECQVERENKLFIGMLPKTVTEEQLHDMFVKYGDLREVHIIRGPEGASKGCAFVKFVERDAALVAIEEMNNKVPDGSTRPLVIKFADVKKHGKKVDGEDFAEHPSVNAMKSPSYWQPSIQPPVSPYYYPYSYAQGASGVPLPQQVMQSYVPFGAHNISPEPSYMILNSGYPQTLPVVLSNDNIADASRSNQLSPLNYNPRVENYDRRQQNYSQQVDTYDSTASIPKSTSDQRLASMELDDSPQSPTRPPEGTFCHIMP
jgi:RNA recognition motif-containing protein